jgi:aryl-alcohol dehydrogenase-like predicted oxidoreductase
LAGSKLGPNRGPIGKREVPGLEKKASVVALGFEDFRTFSSGSILLDAFWERGGNLFDTGFIYGQGYTETLLGEWLKNRGVRSKAVVIGKGAHTPMCYPQFIGQQLEKTLERLKTDHVDVYFMHRDNTDVPVGEFVDAVHEQVKLGRIRGPWGGSNWTLKRMKEAIAYAKRKRRTAPRALSNNFALAKMLDPIWAGCLSCSDDAYRAWLKKEGVANFSWSSQGRGFFTERAGRDKRGDAELVRCWYSAENFARRDRAVELARRMGRNPIHVALAYVLAQDFTSIPLIGPRTLGELDDSVSALDIVLSAEDRRWLETGHI